MTKVRVNMKNGDKFNLNFEIPEMSIEKFLTNNIFKDFDKRNDLNMNGFKKEDGKIVIITLEDISSVEIL